MFFRPSLCRANIPDSARLRMPPSFSNLLRGEPLLKNRAWMFLSVSFSCHAVFGSSTGIRIHHTLLYGSLEYLILNVVMCVNVYYCVSNNSVLSILLAFYTLLFLGLSICLSVLKREPKIEEDMLLLTNFSIEKWNNNNTVV